MRIIIDMQGVQAAGAADCDDARDATARVQAQVHALVRALIATRGGHELVLVLNGVFGDAADRLRAAFLPLLPETCLRLWQAPGPLAARDSANDWRRASAALLREAFIASLQPDVVLLTSLFDGWDDDAVTSVGRLARGAPTAVLFHETLVPAREPADGATAWLREKCEDARRADLLLAISPAARQQAVARGIDGAAIVTIAVAPAPADDMVLRTAQQVLAALEQLRRAPLMLPSPPSPPPVPARRPRLAYVSPLPPERSGIADYSAELLPALAQHYEIEVVTPQAAVSDPWIAAHCPLRTPDWFRQHAGRYDRVLYHVGNSMYHSHMLALIEEIPGVVVLHDFFLSALLARMESTGVEPGCWVDALYDSHGYAAVAERLRGDSAAVAAAYPCNLAVLRAARSIIVHADHSRALAHAWYGPAAAAMPIHTIAHLRVAVAEVPRSAARQALGFDAARFIVCSFGLLGPTKLNDRLLDAWLASALAQDARCELVFVGEHAGGAYGAALLARIAASPARSRIRITGWADGATYRHYLAAADVGVQLRMRSRGETSGTVLDCMNYGLATIVNAHGSLAELPIDAVLQLPDQFDDAALVAALERLHDDGAARACLAARGRACIASAHAPARCAAAYRDVIEQRHQEGACGAAGLLAALAALTPTPSAPAVAAYAQAHACTLPPAVRVPQILIEVDPVAGDAACGDSVRAMLRGDGSHGRIEPVYLDADGCYRYARQYALGLLDCPAQAMFDEVADFFDGDVLVPLADTGVAARAAQLAALRRRGIGLLKWDALAQAMKAPPP